MSSDYGTLTFGDRHVPIFYGMAPELCDAACTEYIEGDVLIAFHASQGAGSHYWQAPARASLHAINGRPC